MQVMNGKQIIKNDIGNYQLRSEKSAAGDIIDFGNDRGMIGS